MPYDKALLQRYRKALDTTVKIATVHNIDPISGTTIIFCNLGYNMNRPCTAARGLGKPRMVGTGLVADTLLLLGLVNSVNALDWLNVCNIAYCIFTPGG